jgi:uncharacterized protein YndB with AHSA1/START domain
MWSTEASAETSATPEQVWRIWRDVEGWPRWDPSVRSSSLDGPFVTHSRGRIEPRGGPATDFVLSEVVPGSRFVSSSRLPLARMDFVHEARSMGGRTRITHRIEISGPLSALFGRLLGPGLARDLPRAVAALAAAAEDRASR